MRKDTEILKDNRKIIDFHFDNFYRTKNVLHINNLIKIISDYANPCWENILLSDDVKTQIALYLMSRYIMELLSFYINIQKDEDLKDILNQSSILDDKVKTYIANKKYSNIKKRYSKYFKNIICKKQTIG
jgi:hypothetical protein